MDTCTDILRHKQNHRKEWFSDTWTKIEHRKDITQKINREANIEKKVELQQEYSEADRKVTHSAKNDNKHFIEQLAEKAETAALQHNMKDLYAIPKQLSEKNRQSVKPIKDKNGNILNKEEEQLKR